MDIFWCTVQRCSERAEQCSEYSWACSGHVGVRDLVARGYFIPGGASQRGGGSGSGVPCRTLSDLDDPGLRSVTCDVSSRRVLTLVQELFESTIPPCTEFRYNLNGRSRLASYRKPQKGNFLGACRVLAKKRCAFQRGSGQKVMISTSGPAAEILDAMDGCAVKS